IDALSRPEFLNASAVDLRDVEVAFLIHTETVYTPEAAGKIAPDAPRIKEVPIEIIFQHSRCSAVESPKRAVGADVNQVNVGRIVTRAPFVKIFPIFIKDLNPVVCAVVHEYPASLRVDGDSVHVVHVTRPLLVWRIAFHSPGEEELAVLGKLRDA